MRLDIEAMQAERLGVGAARHGAEGAIGGVAVARKLRRLRGEQQRQRLAGRDPVDFGRKPARGGDIAGADGDQPVRDRLIGAHAAAVAAQVGEQSRRTPDGADETPERTNSATSTRIAAPRTMSEVSMRRPCHTITTSPGRSAIQATASDSAPTAMRKETTRIIVCWRC